MMIFCFKFQLSQLIVDLLENQNQGRKSEKEVGIFEKFQTTIEEAAVRKQVKANPCCSWPSSSVAS